MKFKLEFKNQPSGYQQVNLLTKGGYLVWSTAIYPMGEPLSEEEQKKLIISDIQSEIATYNNLIKKFERILKGIGQNEI